MKLLLYSVDVWLVKQLVCTWGHQLNTDCSADYFYLHGWNRLIQRTEENKWSSSAIKAIVETTHGFVESVLLHERNVTLHLIFVLSLNSPQHGIRSPTQLSYRRKLLIFFLMVWSGPTCQNLSKQLQINQVQLRFRRNKLEKY